MSRAPVEAPPDGWIDLMVRTPPPLNKCWAPVRVGEGCRLVRRTAYDEWLQQWSMVLAGVWGRLGHPAFSRSLRPETRLWVGIDYRRDLDSAGKQINDALEMAGIIDDDRWVMRSRQERDASIIGWVRVEIRPFAREVEFEGPRGGRLVRLERVPHGRWRDGPTERP